MVLVAGTTAIDTIQTPDSAPRECIGGSAVHFAYAAALFGPVRIVSIAGDDFPPDALRRLEARGIDTACIRIAPGKTFRWSGKYLADMDHRETLATDLNVAASWEPEVPPAWSDTRVVFLANGSPRFQRAVMAQVAAPDIVVCDTMDYWIESERAELDALLREVDGILMNEDEIRMYTGEASSIRAAQNLLSLGPEFIIVKKGAHGALLATQWGVDALPAYPVARVCDPTGAGDSFAGGFLGYLGAAPSIRDRETLKRALARAACVASFNVEDFGAARLESLTAEEFQHRVREYARMLSIG